MATKAKIRAMAKALCFRACTDCKSADECDPDKNWIEEALAILERPGPADSSMPQSRFRYSVRAVGNVRLPMNPGRAGMMTHDYKRDDRCSPL